MQQDVKEFIHSIAKEMGSGKPPENTSLGILAHIACSLERIADAQEKQASALHEIAINSAK